MKKNIPITFIASMMMLCIHSAQAQDAHPFPNRAIRLVVSAPPGSTPDAGARAAAKYMAIQLKQPVVVENKPGANGLIAAREVYNSAPDGYTYLIAPSGTMSITPHVYKTRGADLLTKLTAVGQLYYTDFSIIVTADSPYKNVADIIKAAQQSPGKLVAAYSGVGSASHASIELFKKSANIDLYTVSFDTSPAAAIAVAAGDANLLFETVTSTDPIVKSGKAKRIAMTGAERFELTPDIPTVNESGLEGFVVNVWAGVFAPKGVPQERIDTIAASITAACKEPELQKIFNSAGLLPGKYSAQEFEKFWHSQSDMWRKVVESTPQLELEK
jgi:tripartite-type tricarboxylate transporter receptor subunit TctC